MWQQLPMPCVRCGAERREDERFCRDCGAPVTSAQSAGTENGEPPCWYCNRRPAERDSAANVEMHADAKRSFAGLTAGGYRTRIEWRSQSVVAPRCSICMGGHKAAYRWERAGLWLGILLGAPVWLLLFAATGGSGAGMVAGMIVGFPGSMLWLWWLGRWIGERRAARAGTRPFKAGSRAYPAVAAHLVQGWRLGKPRGVR